jgi:hypothetical protein
MRFDHGMLLVACGLLLIGCPKKKEDDIPPLPTPTQTATAAPTATPTQLQLATPQGIIKPEVDNRADGITGVPVVAPGAKAIIQAPPQPWKMTKTADAQIATAADDKVRIAAAAYGPEGAAAKLEKVATASGITACQWSGVESAIVGKDKLASQVADGNCQRNGTPVKAAYMATEGLLVVGSWDESADRSPVFGSMRSVSKAVGGGDATGIAACCNAISQNAKSAPPQYVPYYMTALGVCNGLRSNPQGRAMLGSVRSALGPAAVPAQCR